MFCSKCGLAFEKNEANCPHCGEPAGAPLHPLTADALDHNDFERAIRRLSRFWYLFAGLSLALGVMGLVMVQTGLANAVGPWEPWPHPPIWEWTLVGGAGWTQVAIRVVLSAAAGWGLEQHTDWGRPVAIFAGAFSFLQFPIGLVLGAYTLIVLLGRHHGELYHRMG
jgi:hypothetical protein